MHQGSEQAFQLLLTNASNEAVVARSEGVKNRDVLWPKGTVLDQHARGRHDEEADPTLR